MYKPKKIILCVSVHCIRSKVTHNLKTLNQQEKSGFCSFSRAGWDQCLAYCLSPVQPEFNPQTRDQKKPERFVNSALHEFFRWGEGMDVIHLHQSQNLASLQQESVGAQTLRVRSWYVPLQLFWAWVSLHLFSLTHRHAAAALSLYRLNRRIHFLLTSFSFHNNIPPSLLPYPPVQLLTNYFLPCLDLSEG